MVEEQKPEKKGPRRPEGRKATSIVRIAGKDVDGSLPIARALGHVKGIGFSMARALTFVANGKLGISPSTEIGSLNEDQVTKLEALIKEPAKYGVPSYLLNRHGDFETGKDIHVVGNDLIFNTRQDVARDVTLRVWRGMRHQFGQKVRGQRTRSTGRTGSTVGVMKKAVLQKGAAAGKGKEEPKK
jgi:small subunit ribosomal protein S13